MAIIKCGEVNRTTSQNWKYQRQYTRKYKVQSSIKTEDPLSVVSAVDPVTGVAIPAVLAAFPTDPFALVQERKATQTTDLFFWDVDVSYSSVFDQNPASQNENPLLRPALWSFSGEKAEKAVREDLDGEPINNSAGVPIDPPVLLEHSIPIISISVNKATFNKDAPALYQDCVNSDTWFGYAPHTVKIRTLEANEVWENNLLYFQVKWVLAVKWDLWYPTRILDQGYHELLPSGEHRLIREKFTGAPLPSPSLLDGNGMKLPSGNPAEYIEYFLNREVAFTGVIP